MKSKVEHFNNYVYSSDNAYQIFAEGICKKFAEEFHNNFDINDILNVFEKRLQLMVIYSSYLSINGELNYVYNFFKDKKDIVASEILAEYRAVPKENELRYLMHHEHLKDQIFEVVDGNTEFCYVYAFEFRKHFRNREYTRFKEAIDEFEKRTYNELNFKLDPKTGIPTIFQAENIKKAWAEHMAKYRISGAGLFVFFDVIKRARRLARELTLEDKMDIYFAEFIRCEYIVNMLKQKNPDFVYEMRHIFAPLIEYFDDVMAPQITLELINDEHYKILELPDKAKLSLRTYKQHARVLGYIEMPDVTKNDEPEDDEEYNNDDVLNNLDIDDPDDLEDFMLSDDDDDDDLFDD